MQARTFVLALSAALVLPSLSYADDIEVIEDPELNQKIGDKGHRAPAKKKKKKAPEPTNVTLEEETEATPPAPTPEGGAPAGGALGADGEQIIDDPEITQSEKKDDGSFGDIGGPREARWGVSLHTRWGIDTQRNSARPQQDIIEGTTVGVIEVEQKRSDELLLSLGLRFRHAFAKPSNGTPGYDLDAAPISAFADVTPTPGFHIRAGYQVITMGRFDGFTATNFLAVYDLRSGPVTMPEASSIGQPAVRIDVDAVSGFTLQAFYIPFFQPHLYPIYGGNYAPLDRAFAISDDPGLQAIRGNLDQILVRSKLSRASTSFAQAFAPAPDFLKPQGALRATFSGSAGELSFTVGTALEKLPSTIRVAQPDPTKLPEITLDHDRFYVASMDGALDLGPFQVGAEFAYLAHRTMNSVGTLAATADLDAAYPLVSGHVNMIHGGLRAELLENAGWNAAIEAFVLAALSDPNSDAPAGRSWERLPRWVAFEDGRFQRGVAGGVQFAPEDTGLKFELAAVAFTGPSYFFMPRIEWEAATRFYLEVGGVFVGGAAPGGLGSPNVSLAGLYSDIDQVFAGIRWLP